jgi:hypothetical protein
LNRVVAELLGRCPNPGLAPASPAVLVPHSTVSATQRHSHALRCRPHLAPPQPATPRPSATARRRWCWPQAPRYGSTACPSWVASWALAMRLWTLETSPQPRLKPYLRPWSMQARPEEALLNRGVFACAGGA